jgi:hypothetical protein
MIGEVDDAGHELGVMPAGGGQERGLVDAEGGQVIEPGRIVDQRPAMVMDRPHDGVPADPVLDRDRPQQRSLGSPGQPWRGNADAEAADGPWGADPLPG